MCSPVSPPVLCEIGAESICSSQPEVVALARQSWAYLSLAEMAAARDHELDQTWIQDPQGLQRQTLSHKRPTTKVCACVPACLRVPALICTRAWHGRWALTRPPTDWGGSASHQRRPRPKGSHDLRNTRRQPIARSGSRTSIRDQ
jgi:hypothetical protein